MTTILTYGVLLAVTAAAWAHVVWMAMTDEMAGMDMVITPTFVDALAFVAAWAVMMAAMMLPSALPMIGLYAAMQRTETHAVPRAASVVLFTLIYLGLWAATGVPMYVASVALSAIASGARAYGVAAALVVAGVFQLSPLKQVCLRHCRSPLGFFLGRWGAGWRGSLALGWSHATYCLGCCWALMGVLFVVGVMNLVWVAALTVFVLIEKIGPAGTVVARLAGAVMVVFGVFFVVGVV